MTIYIAVLYLFFILFFKSLFVFVYLDRSLIYIGIFSIYVFFFYFVVDDLFKKKRIDKLSLFLIYPVFLVTLLLPISFTMESVVSAKTAIESYVILSLPYIMFFLLMRMRYEHLLLLKKIVTYFVYILVSFSLIEFLLPKSLILDIGSKYLSVKTGLESTQNAYFVRDFNLPFDVLRSGSILFEPVTYSIICMLSFGLLSRHKYMLFLSLMSTVGKSAIIGFFIALFVEYFPRIRKIVVITFLFFLAFFIINIDVLEKNIPPTSIGLHLLGLINGLQSLSENIFIGNGLGSAGYGAYLEAKSSGVLNEYFDESITAGVSNGNESYIGILMFQLGLIPFILYIFPFIYGLRHIFTKKVKLSFGLLFSFLLISFFTETVSSMLLLSMASLIFVLTIRNIPSRVKYD